MQPMSDRSIVISLKGIPIKYVYRRTHTGADQRNSGYLGLSRILIRRPPQSRVRRRGINGRGAPGRGVMGPVATSTNRIHKSRAEDVALFQSDNVPPGDGVQQGVAESIGLR